MMNNAKKDYVVYPILPPNEVAQDVVASARFAFNSGKTKSVEFRRTQLKRLLCMVEENTDAFVETLRKDLGRPRAESITCDVDFATNDIKRILYNLDEWVKPTYPTKTLAFMTDVLKVINDPYGVVLIIGPWNYPLGLVMQPLAGAIAAGNCVIVKPSEMSATTSELIATLIPKYLDAACYQVFLGAVQETTILLQERFDYIFFTGSTKVGQIVYAAANKYLTPVTLEMGGKSPTYIDSSANMQMSVRRILWGKCINAGQTCIAPDYFLCTKQIQEEFLTIAKQVLLEWYGNDIKTSPSYSRIVNQHHFNRLITYLTDKNNIALGGESDASQCFIEPTILTSISSNHPVMQDEIFGPILPIITVKDMHEAAAFINAREKPLAVYVFTKKTSVKDFFVNNTSSGTVLINDIMLQCAALNLPFGGVGLSGIGKYHAKDSFDTFVHKKSVMEKNFNVVLDKALAIRYPPYTSTKTNLLKKVMQTRRGVNWEWWKYIALFCLGVVFMIGVQLSYFRATDRNLF